MSVISRKPVDCFDDFLDAKEVVVRVFADRIFCLTNRSDVTVNRSPGSNWLVSLLRKEYAVLVRFVLVMDCRRVQANGVYEFQAIPRLELPLVARWST